MGIVSKFDVKSFDALALALYPFVGDVNHTQLIGALQGAGMPAAQVNTALTDMAHDHVVGKVNAYRTKAGLPAIAKSDFPEGSRVNLDNTVTLPDGSIHPAGRDPLNALGRSSLSGHTTDGQSMQAHSPTPVNPPAAATGVLDGHPAGSKLSTDGKSVVHPDGTVHAIPKK